MTDHLKRFRDFMEVEARFLAAAAARARVLDHKGNRGSDAEQSFIRWLRDRIEPEFTISSGEVVDSFRTNVERDSRQHDAIVHQNTRYARRFALQSGLRLVPVETVATVVEVKLSVDATSFKEADGAASETRKLRLAVDKHGQVAGAGLGTVGDTFTSGPKEGFEIGARELAGRVQFVLFAFEGPSEVATMAGWLKEAKTISAVCSLNTGCATRFPQAGRAFGTCFVAPPERGLTYFSEVINGSIYRFEENSKTWRARSDAYEPYRPLSYWDDTGYVPPAGHAPMQHEIDELIRLGHLPEGWSPTNRIKV